MDFFGRIDADSQEIQEALRTIGTLTILSDFKNIHIYVLNDVKIDIVNYILLFRTSTNDRYRYLYISKYSCWICVLYVIKVFSCCTFICIICWMSILPFSTFNFIIFIR
nr:hypothetical protein [Bacteroides acidifaciens]